MFQKKPIYIIGLVLCTLVLLAGLVLYLFIPGGFPHSDPGGAGSGMPGGFAPGNSDFDSLGGDTENSGGFDFGNIGALPPSAENGNFARPDGFHPSNMPGMGQMGGPMAVLTTVHSAFWPVLIVCVLGDSLCIFMLIRIRRKKKAFAPAEQSPILVEDA